MATTAKATEGMGPTPRGVRRSPARSRALPAAFAAAVLDDEHETDEEREAVAVARAEVARGDLVSLDDARAALGL
jgi:hypothetical protein